MGMYMPAIGFVDYAVYLARPKRFDCIGFIVIESDGLACRPRCYVFWGFNQCDLSLVRRNANGVAYSLARRGNSGLSACNWERYTHLWLSSP